jgi:hypothetical protein
MKTIKDNWRLVSLFFVLGFFLANLLWFFGFKPKDIRIFGISYTLPFSDNLQIPQDLCKFYNFDVSEPIGGYILTNGQVRIDGVVSELPPYGSVWLVTIADTDPVTYWPQSMITVDPTTKKWNGVVYSTSNVTVAIVVPGDNGRILFDYFGKVVDSAYQQKALYPGLKQLPNDVQTCKTVIVRQP